ncbi:MAG TPA: hypothetical protein VJ028_01965, partial [Patescibacteria group bacterium]|nr:hypothetical protein [Patescibacteria group bacterium]
LSPPHHCDELEKKVEKDVLTLICAIASFSGARLLSGRLTFGNFRLPDRRRACLAKTASAPSVCFVLVKQPEDSAFLGLATSSSFRSFSEKE